MSTNKRTTRQAGAPVQGSHPAPTDTAGGSEDPLVRTGASDPLAPVEARGSPEMPVVASPAVGPLASGASATDPIPVGSPVGHSVRGLAPISILSGNGEVAAAVEVTTSSDPTSTSALPTSVVIPAPSTSRGRAPTKAASVHKYRRTSSGSAGSMYRACPGCSRENRLAQSDAHEVCLFCLGKDHDVALCAVCQKFAQGSKRPEA